MQKYLNFNYFIRLNLYLGTRLQNRKVWIQNFILGSRGFWDILNILELIKSLEILGPIIVTLVKKGGTILVINNNMSIESKILSKMFSTQPYNGIVYLYLDNWLKGTFTNFFNFKFLNLRQLPSILFLLNFTNNMHLLNEASFLRIPIIALVDSSQNFAKILHKIAIPLPINNSIKSIYFFFNFLKYYILKGLYYYDYFIIKDTIFSFFFKNVNNLTKTHKNSRLWPQFFQKQFKYKKFLFFFNHYLNTILDENETKDKNIFLKSLSKINVLAIFNRMYIKKIRRKIFTFSRFFDERFSHNRIPNNYVPLGTNSYLSYAINLLAKAVNKQQYALNYKKKRKKNKFVGEKINWSKAKKFSKKKTSS